MSAFERVRTRLAATVVAEAERLTDTAIADAWHDPVVDRIREVIVARAEQVR
jgi:hypothetical protein